MTSSKWIFLINITFKQEVGLSCAGSNHKHQKRDLGLPKHRQYIKSFIEQDLLNDENVLAVFYGGSMANQKTDLYSDIDLRIVVKEEVYEAYRLTKKQRAQKWGKVLFFEDFPWATHTVAHYDTFIKVDIFYYKIKDIQPSVWLQNIKIVRDWNGLLKNGWSKSRELSYRPNEQKMKIWRAKFLAHVHEVYRRVMRKEIYYALNCLDRLRQLMVIGWYMEAGIQPNAIGDWAKYEGIRSQLTDFQLELLERWFSTRDSDEIMLVITKMMPEFKKVHTHLCHVLGLEENQEWIDEILHMVL